MNKGRAFTPSPINKKHKLVRGFTLIEILVVITIIALFAGLSLAYYGQLTESKNLRGSTENLVNVMELAKKRTQAGDLHDRTCTNFSGYRVEYNNATSYRLMFCCTASCTNIRTHGLESGNVFRGSFSAHFLPLTGVAAASRTIIQNSSSGACRSVDVSVNGAISSDRAPSCT